MLPTRSNLAPGYVIHYVDDAGPGVLSEYSVMVTAQSQKGEGPIQRYLISGGWPAVARDLKLKAGDRVQLKPVSRDPWRLRLTLLPTDSGRLQTLNAEPQPRGSEAEVGAPGDSQSGSSAASERASEEVSSVSVSLNVEPPPRDDNAATDGAEGCSGPGSGAASVPATTEGPVVTGGFCLQPMTCTCVPIPCHKGT